MTASAACLAACDRPAPEVVQPPTCADTPEVVALPTWDTPMTTGRRAMDYFGHAAVARDAPLAWEDGTTTMAHFYVEPNGATELDYGVRGCLFTLYVHGTLHVTTDDGRRPT